MQSLKKRKKMKRMNNSRKKRRNMATGQMLMKLCGRQP